MNTLEAISARKSVRSYISKPVEREKLETIVNAGTQAPRAGKVRFIVITNPNILSEIQQQAKGVMLKSKNKLLVSQANTPGFEALFNAPAAIVIITDTSTGTINTANGACAAANILIAATELGIASCYTLAPTPAFKIREIAQQVGIKKNESVACVITLGYSDDTEPHVERHAHNINWIE